MNILQQEDMVKGLPNDRLIREAQAPSGEYPQFLVVSELQRRSDMSKRYEAQKKLPETTVSEQIINEGIGAMRQPPPNMPDQLPTGQGIIPSNYQTPPPQPPNAAILPPGNGMAKGGLVRMDNGGQVPRVIDEARFAFDPYTLRIEPPFARTNVNAVIDPMMREYERESYRIEPPFARSSVTSTGPTSAILRTPLIDRGADPMVDRQRPDRPVAAESTYTTAFQPNIESNIPEAAIEAFDVRDPEIVAKINNRKSTPEEFKGIVAAGIDMAAPEASTLNDPDYVPKSWDEWKARAISRRQNGPTERYEIGADGYVTDDGGVGGLSSSDGTWWDSVKGAVSGAKDWAVETWDEIHDWDDYASGRGPKPGSKIAEQTAEQEALEKIVVDVERHPGIIPNADEEKVAQRAEAEGITIKGSKSGNTKGIEDLIRQQKDTAWGNFLIQAGAGIAGDKMYEGISAGGEALQHGQDQVNRLTMEAYRQQSYEQMKEAELENQKAIYGAGGAGKTPADMVTTQWFLNQPKEIQDQIMRFKGRDLPEDQVRAEVSKLAAKFLEQNREWTEADAANAFRTFEMIYGVSKASGQSQREKDYAQAQMVLSKGYADLETVKKRLLEKYPDLDVTGLG